MCVCACVYACLFVCGSLTSGSDAATRNAVDGDDFVFPVFPKKKKRCEIEKKSETPFPEPTNPSVSLSLTGFHHAEHVDGIELGGFVFHALRCLHVVCVSRAAGPTLSLSKTMIRGKAAADWNVLL